MKCDGALKDPGESSKHRGSARKRESPSQSAVRRSPPLFMVACQIKIIKSVPFLPLIHSYPPTYMVSDLFNSYSHVSSQAKHLRPKAFCFVFLFLLLFFLFVCFLLPLFYRSYFLPTRFLAIWISKDQEI